MLNPLLAAVQINELWFALPLIIAVSFVYAATRHERMVRILLRGLRVAVMITVFMGLILVLLVMLSWLT
jgi:hypothetical protein